MGGTTELFWIHLLLGSNETGMWRPTPPKFLPGAGVQFQKVTPWVMDSPDQFRPAAPPALESAEYEKSYLESTCRLLICGIVRLSWSSVITRDQTTTDDARACQTQIVMSVGNATSTARANAQTEEVYLWNEFPDVLLFGVVDQVANTKEKVW